MISSRFSFKTLLAAGVATLALSSAHAMTLPEAVQTAINTNPLIGEAASLRAASDKELREARGQYLPSADIAAGIGREWTNSPQTRIRGDDDVLLTRKEVSGIIRQRLFDGFETGSQVERQKAQVRAAALQVYQTAQLLGLDAATSYLEVVRQQNLVQLARNNLNYHQSILGDISKRVEGGASDRTDINLVEARLAQVQSTLAQQIERYRNAIATFNRIVGNQPQELTTPGSVLSILPQNRAAAVELAVQQNPAVQIDQQTTEAAEASIDVARSNLYPKINLEGESIYQDDADGLRGYDSQHRIMVRARWNILNGGSNVANVSEQKARYTASRYRVDATVREAEEEASLAWDAFEAAVQRFKFLSNATQFNSQTVTDYRKQFDISKRTLLDLLDAQDELFNTQGQMITSQLNMEAAGYRILAVTGGLLKALNVAAPAESAPVTDGFLETVFRP